MLAYSVTTPFASSVPATCNTASKLLYDIVLIIVVVLAVIIAIVVFVIFVTVLFKYIILHAHFVSVCRRKIVAADIYFDNSPAESCEKCDDPSLVYRTQDDRGRKKAVSRT